MKTQHSLTKFNRRPMEVEEAVSLLLPNVNPIEAEKVELPKAIGRKLSEDIDTPNPIPHFRRSGYDGFAVRASDLQHTSKENPVRLKMVDNIPCGSTPHVPLQKGETARIMTGAMVPEDADSIVMLEAVQEEIKNGETYVLVRNPVEKGANVTPIGEEVSTGTVLLKQGTRIEAGEMAVLASLGFWRVPVYKKPKIAILSTGTELLDVTDSLVAGKIRNSNTYMLAAQIEKNGGEPIIIGNLSDDVKEMREKVFQLLQNENYQMVITTGGVSVGDYDIMTDIFLSWDGKTLFNKVKMRPGSVTTAGLWGDKFLFGLSGNPGACFVGFELFVRAVMDQMMPGEKTDRKVTAHLECDFRKTNPYTRFVRGKYFIKDGEIRVHPVGLDKSSALLSMKDANCLIVIPPTTKGLSKGKLVEIMFV